jgi:hypothetical protein
MRLTIYLDPPQDQALLRLAQTERRRPSDQATVLIERALTARVQEGRRDAVTAVE